MPCEFFRQGCLIGGTTCGVDGYAGCEEAKRLTKIKGEKCPEMVAAGYSERLCVCDMPFYVRAMVPGEYSCYEDGKCQFAVLLPDVRSEATSDKFKPTPDEKRVLAATVKIAFIQSHAAKKKTNEAAATATLYQARL